MAAQADGADILTIEGLEPEKIGEVLQQCFIENGAVQCGFCTPGMLMSAYALLMKNPAPTRDEIKLALAGNFAAARDINPFWMLSWQPRPCSIRSDKIKAGKPTSSPHPLTHEERNPKGLRSCCHRLFIIFPAWMH